jgi:7-cyano-7-deazaguanine tRNA-ribosyltransferase
MVFELRDRDILGRIGRLTTKTKKIETPAFMPVVNPLKQMLSPYEMFEDFGCNIIITNAYIIKKHFNSIPEIDIHNLLNYPGVVMTDSGAYQILVYGGIEVTQKEIINFQKKISSDIGVILDIPTGWDLPRCKVEYTVEETLRRAEESIPLIKDHDALWVGPIQGGRHLDLVTKSAKKIGGMPFHIHALGSPTEVMERYMFSVLVDMIMTAKINIPLHRPLHLFGAGHPMIFSMAVALGCDLFDSASYALYARDDRYLTSRGTMRLQNINYLSCTCPVCRNISAQDLKEKIKSERELLLLKHNLYMCMAEIQEIKQSISEGSLWNLVEIRSRSHPALGRALKTMTKYKDEFEKYAPGFKGKGIFYNDYQSLANPTRVRYNKRLENNYVKPKDLDILLLMKAPSSTPYKENKEYKEFLNTLRPEIYDKMHICFYAAPYGCIPSALSETYPLSQFEITLPIDHETMRLTIKSLKDYLKKTEHKVMTLYCGKNLLDKMVEECFIETSEIINAKKMIIKEKNPWEAKNFINLNKKLEELYSC